MSSSSSSGYSDEDTEASAPSAAAPPSASELGHVVELAQICSFCSTFRQPLRLPSFSRTELQEAILGASSGAMTHVELLAELHFKLAREHPTAKMEKMVQDWEKTLARKLQENWRKEFTANPMAGGVTYRELTVYERVKILDALCHWKLDTCAEIHKHIATLQKENDNEAIKRLRAGEIGTDDNGISYWYFDDGCWIYAEDKPQWQREERKPSYFVEFASAKRIRLSINFDPDHNSSAPPLRLPLKSVAFADEIKEKKGKDVVKVKDESATSETLKVEAILLEMVKQEPKAESSSTTTADETTTSVDKAPLDVKEEQATTTSNGSVLKQDAAKPPALQQVFVQEGNPASSGQQGATVNASGNEPLTVVDEDVSGEHAQASVVAVMGSKKRTIIDDDSSDSSDADTAEKAASKQGGRGSSSPPKKKRKSSLENPISETAVAPTVKDAGESTKPGNPHENGSAIPERSIPERVVSDDKKADTSAPSVQSGEIDFKSASSSQAAATSDGKEASASSTVKEENEATAKVDKDGVGDVSKTDGVADAEKPSGPASTSPTDPAAAPESFDITCESCKKCYDMRYVDPPLVERPSDEWRCFECLVNDARGWPRRRKSTPKEPFSPRADKESSSKRRSSSSKARSSSSSSKKSKKSSSKSRSSSSSKKKSSSSSSSKKKSSSSKSSSSKKSSSSSSSKKHKKRKSSSSSSHHHSSHGHHRRRHRSHHYHEEFAKLVGLFRERQEQRLGIEEARIKGDLLMAFDEAPQGWRVVSSTLDDLRALIQSLSGGSLEQDRLRGRLILIMKDQEQLEEQRRKQQELAWNILPRRQSSRIAIGRMKNQTGQDSDAEDGYSDEDAESRRPGLRSRRSHPDNADGQQKHDRAWRARRRHQVSDDDMDIDDDDDDLDGAGGPSPGNWIDWSLVKGSPRCLSTVCLALVNRLLKEEASDLFSRPVDPELDGCPNYLSVIDHPMDLGTIRSRVETSFYRKWGLFKKDVELVWQNCRTFNAPDTMVVQYADLLSKLSRSMYSAAEKNGVDRMKDKGSGGGDVGGHDSEDSSSDASKAESRSSVNKAWTESSASESSDSSDSGSSSDGDSDSDSRARKRRSSRTSSKKPQSQSRSTRSKRTSSSPANTRVSRSTRSSSSKKRPAPTSSSEESSASEDEQVASPVRKSRRPPRGSASKPERKADPPTEEEDFSDADSASNHPPPPQNGVPSPSPPPPPPPSQSAQKRPKPRLIISDSSSSDDSSGSDGTSSSSSDSEDSDSDSRPASKKPQPPPPSSVPAPPPPSPPPPAASPEDSKPPVRPSPSNKTKRKAAEKKKAKPASAGKTTSGYTHSPPLLNSYLSPSSSSSSDFSSDDSDSSDGDSDSD